MTGPRFSTPSWSLGASLGMASQAYLPMPPKIAGDSRRQTLKYDALTNDELSLTPPAARPRALPHDSPTRLEAQARDPPGLVEPYLRWLVRDRRVRPAASYRRRTFPSRSTGPWPSCRA